MFDRDILFFYRPRTPAPRAPEPHRDIKPANNHPKRPQSTPQSKQKQHDNKRVDNQVSYFLRSQKQNIILYDVYIGEKICSCRCRKRFSRRFRT